MGVKLKCCDVVMGYGHYGVMGPSVWQSCDVCDVSNSPLVCLPVCVQAMYGVLSAIEGLPAFTDTTRHTGIAPWYSAVKREVTEHRGKREEALEPAS